MSTQLIPFQFEAHEIRVITHDDGSWSLVAKDVAEALGYVWAGSATIKHVPDEWKGVNSVLTPSIVLKPAPGVRVMSNDLEGMLRWAEICALPPRQCKAAFAAWIAEQAATQQQEAA